MNGARGQAASRTLIRLRPRVNPADEAYAAGRCAGALRSAALRQCCLVPPPFLSTLRPHLPTSERAASASSKGSTAARDTARMPVTLSSTCRARVGQGGKGQGCARGVHGTVLLHLRLDRWCGLSRNGRTTSLRAVRSQGPATAPAPPPTAPSPAPAASPCGHVDAVGPGPYTSATCIPAAPTRPCPQHTCMCPPVPRPLNAGSDFQHPASTIGSQRTPPSPLLLLPALQVGPHRPSRSRPSASTPRWASPGSAPRPARPRWTPW